MACPVEVRSLLSNNTQPNAAPVNLSRTGMTVVVNRIKAENEKLVKWVMDRAGCGGRPLSYFRLAAKLGLDHKETLIVMAAVHVANPRKFRLLREPAERAGNPTLCTQAFMEATKATMFPMLEITED